MYRFITIGGSPATPSRCAAALSAVQDRLCDLGQQVDAIELREMDPQALLHAQFNHPSIAEAIGRVATADAVILASPVYKASYSGLLKVFLDLLPQNALADKPVLPIVTAGSLAHCLALDYALKPVIAALGGRHILQGACLLDSDFDFDNEVVVINEAASTRLLASVNQLAHIVSFTQASSKEVFA